MEEDQESADVYVYKLDRERGREFFQFFLAKSHTRFVVLSSLTSERSPARRRLKRCLCLTENSCWDVLGVKWTLNGFLGCSDHKLRKNMICKIIFHPGSWEPRQCRICLDYDPSQTDEQDELLAPCLCRGSAKSGPQDVPAMFVLWEDTLFQSTFIGQDGKCYNLERFAWVCRINSQNTGHTEMGIDLKVHERSFIPNNHLGY